jgi:HEAT repeat protein
MSRKNWTVEKLFFRLINNKSDKTYWDNIRELHRRGNKEVFYKGYRLASSKVDKEKIIGIDVLAQLGLENRPFKKQTLKLYFQLLKKEKNVKVLWTTLYAIGHNNEELTQSQIKILTSFINNKNIEIRKSLVYALLAVQDQKAIDTLIILTNDKIASIRDWATFGIGTQIDRNNKSIRDALWKRVNDKDQDTKLEAIFGLAKRKDIRIKEIIKRELLDGEFGTLLFEAIQELNDKGFLPLLKQNLKRYKNNKSIDSVWIKDLKTCINKLKLTHA